MEEQNQSFAGLPVDRVIKLCKDAAHYVEKERKRIDAEKVNKVLKNNIRFQKIKCKIFAGLVMPNYISSSDAEKILESRCPYSFPSLYGWNRLEVTRRVLALADEARFQGCKTIYLTAEDYTVIKGK